MREIAGRLFSSRRRAFIFAFVLTAVTIFVYRPAWNGGFLWDDDVYITNNELLTAPDGLRRICFSHRARALGTESKRLSFDQSCTAYFQRTPGVVGAGAVESPGSMAGWSNFCAASRAGGISRLDHGTQKCTNGVLLFANATCLDCVCWRKNEAALAVLSTRADPLRIGAFGQDNGVHAACRVVLNFMVAPQAHRLEANYPDHTFPCSWHRHGRISDVVGAVPSGNEPGCVYVPEPNRTGSRREPCRLVLSEQTHLAI